MTKVYIAGPYTVGIWEDNLRQVIDAAERLWSEDFTPFLPHLNALWALVYPKDTEEWYGWDMHWLEECDVLLRLDGASVGATREVDAAQELGIPVYHDLDTLIEEEG